MAVFRAYHVHKRDVANPLELLAIAREVDIDTTVLAEDLRIRKYKKEVGADHEEASEPHNIFGVPTILRDGQEPTFIKLAAGTWEGSEDLEFFYDLFKVALRPYVLEIKKTGLCKPGSRFSGASIESAECRCASRSLSLWERARVRGFLWLTPVRHFTRWRSSGTIRV
jgi:hypothetical protein